MSRSYYLAIDIGASSGRHIVGWRENGEIKTEEVYRFPNGVQEANGHLTWDMERLLSEVKTGIAAAKAKYPKIESLSIDTWAVDYVLLQGDKPVQPCYAYRDSRTEAVIPQVHEIVPFEELYAHTGIQFQPFNTIYQLYADKVSRRLEGVTDFLMIPAYLMYRLTGAKVHEYTNATTTGLVSARTGEFDRELIEKLGLPLALFGQLSQPGTVIGEYEGIKVILCATHDTASAVEGIYFKVKPVYLDDIKDGVTYKDTRGREISVSYNDVRVLRYFFQNGFSLLYHINNSGTARATGVRVHMEIPDGLLIVSNQEIHIYTERPAINCSEEEYENRMKILFPPDGHEGGEEDNDENPFITIDELLANEDIADFLDPGELDVVAGAINLKFPEIAHKDSVFYRGAYLIPTCPGDYEIKCTIMCNELADAIVQTIRVVVE